MADFILRDAHSGDIADTCDLVLTHGPSEFNYLPVDAVERHLRQIPDPVRGVVAQCGTHLVGVATFVDRYPDGPMTCDIGKHVFYISEVVVHADFRGRGVGRAMLDYVAGHAARHDADAVYIDRHTDNYASGAMMLHAGYQMALCYTDPRRRTNGSCETALHVRKVR